MKIQFIVFLLSIPFLMNGQLIIHNQKSTKVLKENSFLQIRFYKEGLYKNADKITARGSLYSSSTDSLLLTNLSTYLVFQQSPQAKIYTRYTYKNGADNSIKLTIPKSDIAEIRIFKSEDQRRNKRRLKSVGQFLTLSGVATGITSLFFKKGALNQGLIAAGTQFGAGLLCLSLSSSTKYRFKNKWKKNGWKFK